MSRPWSMELILNPDSVTALKLERKTVVTSAMPPFSSAYAAIVPTPPDPKTRTLALRPLIGIKLMLRQSGRWKMGWFDALECLLANERGEGEVKRRGNPFCCCH